MEMFIPGDSPYQFTIQLKNEATGIPYSLSDLDTCTFVIHDRVSHEVINRSWGTVLDSDTGLVRIALGTLSLDTETGTKVDRGYLKTAYRGIITSTFTNTEKNAIGIIEQIYIV